MIRLITLAVLFLSTAADPRSPRIYNALITSNKNLSPSHAQPVYEPVLRTTSLGYAFPSWFYHTSFLQGVPASYIHSDYSGLRKIEPLIQSDGQVPPNNPSQFGPLAAQGLRLPNDPNINPQQQSSDVGLLPPTGEFPNKSNPYALNFGKYLPKEEEETDPKKVIANLKKNSNIPDVPPPPLPFRIPKKEKQQEA
ncbi:uncharacterized protein [Euwallacea similis]